jgi:DNA-binding CsgD family transcriptional regulator
VRAGQKPSREPEVDATLSPREAEIVHLLGMGNSIGQIADAMGVSYKTIANNCTRIRGKLGLADVKELVRHAVERRFRGTGFG